MDDEDELNRLDGGEGADGEDQSEVRRRIQRVKEDQMCVSLPLLFLSKRTFVWERSKRCGGQQGEGGGSCRWKSR